MDLEQETWRPVFGLDGVYEVSSHGRVKRTKKSYGTNANPLRAGMNNNGYLCVCLYRNAKIVRSSPVHRLVAESFLFGKRLPKGHSIEVNHLNGIKTDNRVCNLELTTSAENKRHARDVLGVRFNTSETARKGEDVWCSVFTEEQIRTIRARCKNGEKHRCIAEDFGVDRTTITAINRRKNWKHVQ